MKLESRTDLTILKPEIRNLTPENWQLTAKNRDLTPNSK
jgi:hypothetical protein